MIIWVDNTAGDDGYIGNDPAYPVASLDAAIDNMHTYGTPGSTIRVCYTGQDYTNESPSYFQGMGTGWADTEKYLFEGYDRNGGYNRPKIYVGYGHFMAFTGAANYCEMRDFDFVWDHQHTSYDSYAFYISNNLTTDPHYFKINRCRFSGVYGTAGTDRCLGVYSLGGTVSSLEIKYCYFYNLSSAFRMYYYLPEYTSLNFSYNILDNPDRQITNYVSTTTQGDFIDVTYANNTCFSFNSSKYSGYFMYHFHGDLTSSEYVTFDLQNNIVSWCNGAFRTVSTDTNGGLIDRVGYNVFGQTNSASTKYQGTGFDIFETDGYLRVTDEDLYSLNASDFCDYVFRSHTDETYRWPDAEWMVIRDLRPVCSETTGTFDDPVYGIKGAITYSGIYKDTSIDTEHYCSIVPAFKTNTYLGFYGFGGSSDAYKLMDTNIEQGLNLSFSTDNTMSFSDFCSFGGIGGSDYTILDIATKPASRVYTSTVTAESFEGRTQDGNSIYARTQICYTGTGDYTSPWSDFLKGSRTNQFTNPAIAGSYNVYFRYWVAQDDNTSAWEQVDSFII